MSRAVLRSRSVGMAILMGGLACLATIFPLAGSASASHQDCRITASGPFFYAGMVFPSTVVECDMVKPRIRIETALTMDGVEVDRSRRDCRKTDICHLEVDVSATDQPGNQVWCTFTTGWVGNHLVGHASSCESEEF